MEGRKKAGERKTQKVGRGGWKRSGMADRVRHTWQQEEGECFGKRVHLEA